MPSWKNSIVIQAPPDRVFAYVSDPSNFPEWIPSMVEIRDVIGTGAGQQYEWTYKMAGILLHGEGVVVEHVPQERSVHQNIGMIEAHVAFSVEPHEEGAALTLGVDYGIPIPVLGRLAERIVTRRNEREFQLALDNAKELFEA
ncbi:MAG: SRPBCC family protein [Deltaproteobacteria bacterium]|nr:SRPBCC family protein [Deltaproteobacteria bacterium]NND26993.1 SRPBCC family protein [Myxococcales bacterium]MBT8464536.1 SRPBCC family protein [Deltaproteobacteria bacterium]MBT8483092.1 SRPBCC family protein [Deltaproteobacteria bacterium]NNK05847.1 SRPBCC family protein [Myxococcales bacterium]